LSHHGGASEDRRSWFALPGVDVERVSIAAQVLRVLRPLLGTDQR